MTDFASRHIASWKAGNTAQVLPPNKKDHHRAFVVHSGQTHVFSIAASERLDFLRWVTIAFPVELAGSDWASLGTYGLRKLLAENDCLVVEL